MSSEVQNLFGLIRTLGGVINDDDMLAVVLTPFNACGEAIEPAQREGRAHVWKDMLPCGGRVLASDDTRSAA